MSNIVFELLAKLGLDTSEFEKGLGQAKGQASSVGGAIAGGLKTAAKVGTAAISAATTATVAFATTSVKAGADFDKSMSQVAATMGKTMEELANETGTVDLAWGTFSGNLREYAQEMGKNTAFSASEAADALNYMALAGYDAQTSMEMLPNVLNLAAAGNMDLAMASDMVTDTQSALGLSLEETTAMVDQMAKASSKTNTSVTQLGDAMLTIGATARGVKGGTVELSTVLGILADNGIKGAEGGTHLRNAILSLQTPTKAGVEALAQLNMTYEDMYDAEGNLRALPEIFQQMSTAMEGMSQQSKDAIISGVFNKTDLAAVNALIGTTTERWNEVTAAINDSKGAAQEMADTQLDNLEGDITLFKSALEGAQVAISDKLTPTLREFVQFGTEGLSSITDAFQKGDLSAAMDALGTVLAEGINIIIEKTPDFVNAGLSLLEAIGRGIIDNAPAMFNALGEIGNILMEKIFNLLSELGNGLGDFDWSGAVTSVMEYIRNFASNIASKLSEVLPTLIPAIVQIIGELGQALTEPSTLVSLVQSAVQIGMAVVQGLINAIPEILRMAPIIISNLVGAIIGVLPTVLSAGVQIIFALISGIVGAIPDLLVLFPRLMLAIVGGIVQGIVAIVETGKQLVDGFVQGIKNAWDGAVQTVVTFFTGFVDRIKALFGVHSPSTVFADIGNNLIQGLIDGISNMMGNLGQKAQEIIDTFAELPGKIVDIGRNIIEGLWDGMSNTTSWIKDKITGWVGDVMSFLKGLFGIASPSKVMRDLIGVNLGKGVAVGIENSLPMVEDALDDMSDLVSGPIISPVASVGGGYANSASVLNAMEREQNPNKNLTVILQLEKTQLARAIYTLNNEEIQRVGVNLAGGYA